MNPAEPVGAEEQFSEVLAACDEALAAGSAVDDSLLAAAAPEVRQRVERVLGCMRFLQARRDERAKNDATAHAAAAGVATPRPAEDSSFNAADVSVDATPARLGRFVLRTPLGQGGFGVVFRAYDPELGRDVALKIPRPDALVSNELRERFQQEARAAAGLDHPHIVPVYEAGQVGPICYIAYAYCPGINLAVWLRGQREPVPVRAAAELVATLAEALEHAHAHGVLHRDLKPSNVLLQESGIRGQESGVKGQESRSIDQVLDSDLPGPDSWVPRITDFGLAKLLEAAPGTAAEHCRTRTGAVVGTPSYMAPEQAAGKRTALGPAVDIYALGAVLYELLTGRPPIQGETDLDTLQRIASEEPIAPTRLRPKVPRDLETICLRALHKEPERRYQSAAAFADDLRRFLKGEPIRARPVTRLERTVKWARRRPAVAGLLAGIVTLATASLVALTLLWRHAETTLDGKIEALQSEKRERERAQELLAANVIAAAHRAWLTGDLPAARHHLEECQEAYRNDDWRHLRRACDAEALVLPRHAGEIMRLAYSRDGRMLASATRFPTIFLWDADSGAKLQQLNGATVLDLLFTPKNELFAATRLAEPKRDAPALFVATFFDPRTGIQRLRIQRPSTLHHLAPLPDGQRFLGVSDKTLSLIALRNGQEVYRTPEHGAAINQLAVSLDGRRMATLDMHWNVRIWDADSGAAVATLKSPFTLQKLAFSPDGRWLASYAADRTRAGDNIQIWDAGSGAEMRTLTGPLTDLLALALSPDGRHLAAAGQAKVITLWDWTAGKAVMQLRGHSAGVNVLAFQPNGKRLASGSADGTVRVWNLHALSDLPADP